MLALVFQVGDDRVAVDVGRIREVVPRVRLSPEVGGPSWLAGRFVYRGRVVPVIDLHTLVGVGPCPPHLSSRIILVPWPSNTDTLVGMLATQVADMRRIEGSPQESEDPLSLGCVTADGSEMLRVLDPNRLFTALAARTPGVFPTGRAA